MSNDIITEGTALRLASEARDRYATQVARAKSWITSLIKSGDLDRDDSRVQLLVRELDIELTKTYDVRMTVTHTATVDIPFDKDIYDYEFEVSGGEITCDDADVEIRYQDVDDIESPDFEEQ
jgi:hypothetical protein